MNTFEADFFDHNFQEIYSTINEFFPIEGRYKKYTAKTILTYPGWNKIGELSRENFIDRKRYNERWSGLQKYLQKTTKKKGAVTLMLSNQCFSGEILVDEVKSEEYIKTKKLHYFISILGPYYTVYAIDRTEVLLPMKTGGFENEKTHVMSYGADHVVTVAPVFEYKEPFLQLQKSIKERFPTYKFVPYEIGISTIDGISAYSQTAYDDGEDDTHKDSVYAAIFGPLVPPKCKARGDERYGFDDWLKPLSDQDQKLMETLMSNILLTANLFESKSTLHKVWKLRTWKRLPLTSPPGGGTAGGMFGVGILEIIDLTDAQSLIFIEGDRKVPAMAPYSIKENKLVFNQNLYYEILDMTSSELKVIMHVDLSFGSIGLKGPVAELVYEALTEWSEQ